MRASWFLCGERAGSGGRVVYALEVFVDSREWRVAGTSPIASRVMVEVLIT
ncbi:hypothetical protein [Caballeronia sp.]|uniref:hypothetical protein n=1 Tax=Caballeronia sp. TaxID=1931223 RepID=UPI003C6F5A3D